MRYGSIVELSGKRLKEPIAYEIKAEEPYNWILWCDEFQLWGSGGSLYDALNELTSGIRAMADDYISTRDDQLGPPAVIMKNRLRYLLGFME